jgi:hypothetical protein
MAGAGKKTFTAGETLTASDMNNFVMDQTVMYFAGTAARASAIPTPSTGMTSYIGVTGTATIPQLETYTGSAWQTPYGSTLVANVSFTTVSSIALDNVFTSAYQNYKIEFNLTTISANASVSSRIRIGGVDTSSSYAFQGIRSFAGSVDAFPRSTGTTQFDMTGTIGSGQDMYLLMDIARPATTNVKHFNVQNFFFDSGGVYEKIVLGGYQLATTSHDGIRFFSTANMTGTVRVYGLRNS